MLLVDPALSNDYLDSLRGTEIMYNAPGKQELNILAYKYWRRAYQSSWSQI